MDGWSTRERTLLAALAAGRSASAIARDEHERAERVRREVRGLRRRLGATTNVQAVAEAVRRGVL
jgi:DNA-binding CsgD family transcriptional regulator